MPLLYLLYIVQLLMIVTVVLVFRNHYCMLQFLRNLGSAAKMNQISENDAYIVQNCLQKALKCKTIRAVYGAQK